ncbi:hypothetical protein ScPMuIL_003118 [Solemya velum]
MSDQPDIPGNASNVSNEKQPNAPYTHAYPKQIETSKPLHIAIKSTFRANRGSTTGYFLAGKNMHWIPIGASIYASNIGAPMFIGLAGSAAASGIAVTMYEWHAVFFLIALGWLYVPVYVASGSYTTPGYLKKRFGGSRICLYSSVLALVGYILHNISAEIYSGAIFMQQLLRWNMYICVTAILAITALYTMVGGLVSVIYTDTLQALILIGGSLVLTTLSFMEVGGWNSMEVKYMHSAANYTQTNLTLYQCGMPREDSFHIFRDPVNGDIPWTGAVTGLSVLGMFTWCQDQIIVQRCLSAKNMGHSKAGCIFASCLKLLGLLTFVIPGMISRILYPEEIACADPKRCDDFCGNEAGCSNLAYPLLVLRLLPAGLRGLMLAALLSALMSSLTSTFNSASSIVTLDIWRHLRKRARETELMVVGRITVLVLAGVSILWLPILEQSQGGILWFYVQAIKSYLVPPWTMVFILAVFWKRTTEQGAFWGLMTGLIVGAVRMGLDFAVTAPLCGSGDPDTRWNIVSKVNFLHFAMILSVTSLIVVVAVSMLTQPRPQEKLHRVTWWTRNDTKEPELSDIEDDESETEKINVSPDTHDKGLFTHYPASCGKTCYNWVCGITKQPTMTSQELKVYREKLTAINEDSRWRKILNILAVIVVTVTVFLFGFFA